MTTKAEPLAPPVIQFRPSRPAYAKFLRLKAALVAVYGQANHQFTLERAIEKADEATIAEPAEAPAEA